MRKKKAPVKQVKSQPDIPIKPSNLARKLLSGEEPEVPQHLQAIVDGHLRMAEQHWVVKIMATRGRESRAIILQNCPEVIRDRVKERVANLFQRRK